MLKNLKKKLDSLQNILKAAKPGNEDEELICEIWLNKRDELMARTVLYIGLLFHSTGLILHPQTVQEQFQPVIYLIHASFLLGHCSWLLFGRYLKSLSIQKYMLIAEAAAVIVFSGVFRYTYFSPGMFINDQIYGATTLVSFIGMLVVVMPFHNKVVPLVAVLYAGIASFAMFDGNTVPFFWANLISSLAMVGLGMQGVHISRTKAAAIKEFRTRAGMAPLQVVRKSIQSDATIEEVFAPKLRYCVCISSDWRGFQELTTRMDTKVVSMSLNAYYEICNDQLKKFFPDGNYYSDWIADELFIVIFTPNPLDIMVLSKKALDFAQSILEEKAKFVLDKKFPFAIDIGMSVGQALVGMMGPSQNRKATALGEVPGLSRRLQGTGKLLRYNLGEKDRIIFAEEFAETLPDNDIVRSYSLGENTKLRDLNCKTLFYVELNRNQFDLSLDQVS